MIAQDYYIGVAACARLNASGSRNVHTLASYSVKVQLSPQAQDFWNRPQAQCLPRATLQHVPHEQFACTRVSKDASNSSPRS